MDKRAPTSTMNQLDQLAALPRREIERIGRRHSFKRSLTRLVSVLALLFPLVLVTSGTVAPVAAVPASVTAGIALILDTAVTLAAVQFAWRCLEMSRMRSKNDGYRRISSVLMGTVVTAAVLNLIENVILWLTTVYPGGRSAPILTSWLFWVSMIIGIVSLICLAVVALLSTRSQPVPPEREETAAPAPSGTIICCSGGGIRSASFCLGGLQQLDEQGVYQAASAVVGVSGGGYIAAAWHVLRWRSDDSDGRDQWDLPQPPGPFSSSSPEFRWLRRHTRYLFDSFRLATLAGLTVIFGMTVNLFWCVLALGALAGWLGWLFNAGGGIRQWSDRNAQAGYVGAWVWLNWLWLVLAIGVMLFVGERCLSRLCSRPLAHRETIRNRAVELVWVGAAITVLVIGLPHLMVAIHDYAAVNATLMARLAYAVGLVPEAACMPAPGCGAAEPGPLVDVRTPWGSLLATVAAILAVVRGGLARIPGEGATSEEGLRKRLGHVLKHIVLPWAALVVIVLVATGLVMRWVASFAEDPNRLSNWSVVLVFGVVAVLLRLLTDANLTSLHHFYRERISYAFIQQRDGRSARPLPYEDTLRFSKSRPLDKGPELVACAAANVTDVEYVPADRRCLPFVFDHERIGITERSLPGRMDATTYEFAADYNFREATMPAAVAMSGAAFSPLVGREQRRVAPYRLIMTLANARLGVWLPNPLWVESARQVRRMIRLRRPDAVQAWNKLDSTDRKRVIARLSKRDAKHLNPEEPLKLASLGKRRPGRRIVEGFESVLDRPGPYRLFKEGIGKTSLFDRRLYVTDGGHYDNLGLVEALRRRPATVYVLDASNDAENSFRTLGEAIATARMDLDCEVSINTTPMITTEGAADVAWTRGTVRYHDETTADVYFVKALRLRGTPLDTNVYARLHSEFPRTGTSDQFYGEFDFEAYRQLGIVATRGMLASSRSPAQSEASTASSRP